MNDLRGTASAPARTPSLVSWILLAVGVASVSVSAILIRYAGAAHPLAISFWRCALGAAALAPFGGSGFRRLTGRGWLLPLIAGVFLATHFAAWITSLQLTTIANSTLLVSTTPVFTALAARYLFKELLPLAAWLGIALTLAGTSLIALAAGGGDQASRVGDMLAVLGAIAVAGYTLAGEVSRRRLGIVEYAAITYGAAAVTVLSVCLAGGIPLWGYPAQTWLALAGIVAGPQLLGHTVLNFVLRDLDSTTVSVAVMAEPPIAVGLAYVIFSEVPSALVYPGGAAILAGILLVSIKRRKPPQIIE